MTLAPDCSFITADWMRREALQVFGAQVDRSLEARRAALVRTEICKPESADRRLADGTSSLVVRQP